MITVRFKTTTKTAPRGVTWGGEGVLTGGRCFASARGLFDSLTLIWVLAVGCEGLWMPLSGVPLQQGGVCTAGGKAWASWEVQGWCCSAAAVPSPQSQSDFLWPCGLSARSSPLSVGFPSQERCSGPPFSPGGLLDPREPESPALASVADRKDLTPER